MIDTTEVERLAQALGGGWSVFQGVVPQVVLVESEALRLDQRIAELEEAVRDCIYPVGDCPGDSDNMRFTVKKQAELRALVPEEPHA